MDEWRECKLSDIVLFQRGHDLTQSNFVKGDFPVAGSNGIIDFHNEFTTKGPGLTLGRSGNSIGVPHYYETNFWAHNTTLYSKEFNNKSFPKFIYYFLKTIDFKTLNTGSAVPSLNRNHIHQLDVNVPPLTEQKAIASVLSSLDDKIDLLHRQNKTLEAMAETLFRQWFVEEAEEDWDEISLGECCRVITKGTTPTTLKKEFVSNGINFIKVNNIDENGNFLIDKFEFIDLKFPAFERMSAVRRSILIYNKNG